MNYVWYTVVHCSSLWYTMVHYSTLWYTVVDSWSTPWYVRVYETVLWTSNSCLKPDNPERPCCLLAHLSTMKKCQVWDVISVGAPGRAALPRWPWELAGPGRPANDAACLALDVKTTANLAGGSVCLISDTRNNTADSNNTRTGRTPPTSHMPHH